MHNLALSWYNTKTYMSKIITVSSVILRETMKIVAKLQ